MIWLLAAALAAGPLEPRPEAPEGADWTVGGALLGGTDRWTDGGGEGLELRLRANVGTETPTYRLSAGWSGVLEALPASTLPLSDGQIAELRLDGGRAFRLGGVARARAGLSGGPAWGEGAAGLLLGYVPAKRTALWLTLSGLVRGDATIRTGGGSASLSFAHSVGRVGFSTRTSAALYGAQDLPRSVLSASARGWYAPIRRLSLDVGTYLEWATAGADPEAHAGLQPPSSGFVGGYTGGSVHLVGPLSARLEVGGEGGIADGWARFRALGGLVVEVRRDAVRGGPRIARDGVRFVYRDKDASEVSVIGSFNDWAPVPLTRQGRKRWVVTFQVSPGEWEYAYQVDGEMRVPPEAVRTRPDGYGGSNGVLAVEPEGGTRRASQKRRDTQSERTVKATLQDQF